MGDKMNVYIYPNNPDDDSLAKEATSTIQSALESVVTYFGNSGESISAITEYDSSHPSLIEKPGLSYRSDKAILLTEFRSWVNSQDPVKEPDTGLYLLVGSDFDGGLSGGLVGGAWKNHPAAVAGKNNAGMAHFKNICIQEVLHAFIDNPDEILDGNEHRFGEVVPSETSSGGKQTPMVTSYVDDGLDGEGNCDRTGENPGYTTELTTCTKDILLETYRNQGQWFT